MIRLWAKTMINQKIEKSIIYESIDKFSVDTFHLHMQQICHTLDISTPVILKTHIQNLINFNTVSFLPRDFVENVNFDKLVIENASL